MSATGRQEEVRKLIRNLDQVFSRYMMNALDHAYVKNNYPNMFLERTHQAKMGNAGLTCAAGVVTFWAIGAISAVVNFDPLVNIAVILMLVCVALGFTCAFAWSMMESSRKKALAKDLVHTDIQPAAYFTLENQTDTSIDWQKIYTRLDRIIFDEKVRQRVTAHINILEARHKRALADTERFLTNEVRESFADYIDRVIWKASYAHEMNEYELEKLTKSLNEYDAILSDEPLLKELAKLAGDVLATKAQ